MEIPTCYSVSTDVCHFDFRMVHAFLVESPWWPGISKSLMTKALANSLCFGAFHGVHQVGFARVVTDRATFAYLADVYILEAHRGKGLSQALMQAVLTHDDLKGLRRFLLATKDAQGLCRQFGFNEVANPSRLLEMLHPEVNRPTRRHAVGEHAWPMRA